MPRYQRPWTHVDRPQTESPGPARAPYYDPDWRTKGAAAEVLKLPPRPARAQPVLECNRIPLRDLSALLEKYGEPGVCRQLNVHRTTVRRWLKGEVQIPGHQLQVIRLLLGHLPGTEGQWAGWSFFKGELVAPNGNAFKAGDVLAIGLERQRVKALEQELYALKIRLAIAEEAERRHAGAANQDLAVRA
jgi:hypothetical protein